MHTTREHHSAPTIPQSPQHIAASYLGGDCKLESRLVLLARGDQEHRPLPFPAWRRGKRARGRCHPLRRARQDRPQPPRPTSDRRPGFGGKCGAEWLGGSRRSVGVRRRGRFAGALGGGVRRRRGDECPFVLGGPGSRIGMVVLRGRGGGFAWAGFAPGSFLCGSMYSLAFRACAVAIAYLVVAYVMYS